jgi:cytoskeletal protein CcmA (bactofilin family)
VEIDEEVSAKNIEVGGVLRSRKATAEDHVEVGGAIITAEGVTAHLVEIGRRGKVRGPIKADQVIIGRDAHAENIYGKKIQLRSGAHAENVYGENITIESNCHISGEVQYTGELRMNENVSLGKTPQRVDRLPF